MNVVISFTPTDEGTNTIILQRKADDLYYRRQYSRYADIESAIRDTVANRTYSGFVIQEVFEDVWHAQGTIFE